MDKVKKKKSTIKVLLEWDSPERMWRPRTRVWFLGHAALFSILILVAARLGSLIIIIGLIALLFLLFVEASIPPLISKHKVTSKGLITRDTLFSWDNMIGFWFGVKRGTTQLYLDFKPEAETPRIITLLPNPSNDEDVFNEIIKHIKYSDQNAAGYNFIASFLYGSYVPVSKYLQDLDQPDDEDEEITEPITSNDSEKDS